MSNHTLRLIAATGEKKSIDYTTARETWMVHMCGGRHMRWIIQNWDIRRYTIKRAMLTSHCEKRTCVCRIASRLRQYRACASYGKIDSAVCVILLSEWTILCSWVLFAWDRSVWMILFRTFICRTFRDAIFGEKRHFRRQWDRESRRGAFQVVSFSTVVCNTIGATFDFWWVVKWVLSR